MERKAFPGADFPGFSLKVAVIEPESAGRTAGKFDVMAQVRGTWNGGSEPLAFTVPTALLTEVFG